MRHQQPLRLPVELAARLRDTARRKGISINDYAVGAIERRLDDDEDAKRQRSLEQRLLSREADRAAPRGLGLRHAPPPSLPPLPADPPQALVVHVGAPGQASGQGSSDLVRRLVRYVTQAPTFLQDQRRRHAEDVITDSCESAEEAKAERERLRALVEEQRRSRRPTLNLRGVFR